MNKPRMKLYRNDWSLFADAPTYPGGMYSVTLRNAAGNVHDKVRCDTAADARTYWRTFDAIARAAR